LRFDYGITRAQWQQQRFADEILQALGLKRTAGDECRWHRSTRKVSYAQGSAGLQIAGGDKHFARGIARLPGALDFSRSVGKVALCGIERQRS
jgi:hypothetical protein